MGWNAKIQKSDETVELLHRHDREMWYRQDVMWRILAVAYGVEVELLL